MVSVTSLWKNAVCGPCHHFKRFVVRILPYQDSIFFEKLPWADVKAERCGNGAAWRICGSDINVVKFKYQKT